MIVSVPSQGVWWIHTERDSRDRPQLLSQKINLGGNSRDARTSTASISSTQWRV